MCCLGGMKQFHPFILIAIYQDDLLYMLLEVEELFPFDVQREVMCMRCIYLSAQQRSGI